MRFTVESEKVQLCIPFAKQVHFSLLSKGSGTLCKGDVYTGQVRLLPVL